MLITSPEWIHTFLDYNYRKIGIFLSNKKLIRRDMLPSTMENPNIFDYKIINLSIIGIRQG